MAISKTKHGETVCAGWEDESTDDDQQPLDDSMSASYTAPVQPSPAVGEYAPASSGDAKRFKKITGLLRKRTLPTTLRSLVSMESATITELERVCSLHLHLLAAARIYLHLLASTVLCVLCVSTESAESGVLR